MKKIRIILTVLTILMMCLIFWFSAQPADESTEMSNSIGLTIGRMFIHDFDELTYDQQMQYADSIDHAVRKSAHAAEYMILGILCVLTVLSWYLSFMPSPAAINRKLLLLFLIGWLIASVYAVSDEIHQLFVEGRACLFKDMLIDSSGAAFGALVILLIYHIHLRRRSGRL